MITEKLLERLNDQLNFEFESAHIYLAMAGYCADLDLDGFSNFFLVQAEEERFHAMKFYNFINEMDGRVKIDSMGEPQNEYKSLLDVFKVALEHENTVTRKIYSLMDLANEEREHATISMLKWFVDEQIEEQATFKTLIKKIERLEDNSHGIYMLDQELSARTFTPPQGQQ